MPSPGWTKVPGQKMEHGTGKYDKKMVLHLDANRVEFVTTNGHDWDSPDPYGGNDNYKADVRGVCFALCGANMDDTHRAPRVTVCGCSSAASCARSSKRTPACLLLVSHEDAAALSAL